MTILESLAAQPFTTASIVAISAALSWLMCRISWIEGRDAGRREAPRLSLTYVVREIAVDSESAAQEFGKQTRDRDWVN